MERKIITTNDGSKTIFIPEWNENYHSKHGALQEAMHVFIQSGLHQLVKDEIRILEIGLGSGLNAILTLIDSEKLSKKIEYTGLEAFPISDEEFEALEYTKLKEVAPFEESLKDIFNAEWRSRTQINSDFSIEKIDEKIEAFEAPESYFDLIYFDAFGPRVQPEMWKKEILEKMYSTLSSGGIFVTYCAKGQVRRDLEAVGFAVEKIPGPPGKREMLRANKK
tara:strand:- start:2921 stop:3586 length:666 start_codon:yes stop_codon:yes gene_type:complete